MGDGFENALATSRAYRLFLNELSTNLDFAREVTTDRTEEVAQWKELARIVHMIKGGAGFFGLSDIESIAAQLEGRLKEPLKKVLQQCDELSRLVDELERLQKELPAPTKQT